MQLHDPQTGSIASCLTELATSIPRWKSVQSEEGRREKQALDDMAIGPFRDIFNQLKDVFSEFGDMAGDVRAFFNQDAEGMMNQMFKSYMEDPTRLGGFMTNIENTFGQFRELGTQQANEVLRATDAIKKAFMFHKPEALLAIVLYAISNGFTSIFVHEKLLKLIRTGVRDIEANVRSGGIPRDIRPENPFKEAIEALCKARASLSRVSLSASTGRGFESGACSEGVGHLGDARQALQSGSNSPKFISDVVGANLAELQDITLGSVIPGYQLKLKQESILALIGPLSKTSNDIWNLHRNMSNSIDAFTVNINLDEYFAIIMEFLIAEIERVEAQLRKAVGDMGGEIQMLENQIQQKLALLGQVGDNSPLAQENATIMTQIQVSSSTPKSAAALEKELRSLGIDPGWSMSDLSDEQRKFVESEFRRSRSAYIDEESTEAARNSRLSSRERQEQLREEIRDLRQRQRVARNRSRQFSGEGVEARALFGVLQTHLEAFIQVAMLQGITRAVCTSHRLFSRFMQNMSKFNGSSLISKLNAVLEDLDPSNCPQFWGGRLICNLARYQTTFSRVVTGRSPQSQLISISRQVQSDISKQQAYISCLREKLGVARGEFLAVLAAIGATIQIAALVTDGFTIEKLMAMIGLDFEGLFGGRNMSLYEALLSALACVIANCDNEGIRVSCRRLMSELEGDRERERTRFLNPGHAALEARNANTYPSGGSKFRLAAVMRLIDMIQNFQICNARGSNRTDNDVQGNSESNVRGLNDYMCDRSPGQLYTPAEGDNKALVEDEDMAREILES